ncbi:hypothetical protein HMPREF3196_01766 [Bifidobacterium bifidum]|uniref:Uncharacterized protein n=1 Tax=Bifidobacterium bifidum TaxID=1681 RepID=A0A133KLP2_BIFBI|nr:hypothetical protein HMPREF3196_01766 [Bifidobacterium bifidum]
MTLKHLSAFQGVAGQVSKLQEPHDFNGNPAEILRISQSGNPLKRR